MKMPNLRDEDGYYGGGGPVTIILWVIAIAFVVWLLTVLF